VTAGGSQPAWQSSTTRRPAGANPSRHRRDPAPYASRALARRGNDCSPSGLRLRPGRWHPLGLRRQH
jgi:hypothetical protein